MIRQVNREQVFYLPLIDETRIRAFDEDYPGGSLSTLEEIDGRSSSEPQEFIPRSSH